MNFHSLFGLTCMLLLSSIFVVQASTSTGIIIDGDPSDWTTFGLSPVETDPSFNEPHSYNPVCSDLLEAWACKNQTMLFLMMKVRGGTPDFDEAQFMVMINVDPDRNTGDQVGNDYFVAQIKYGGYLFIWNTTTLTWNEPFSNSKVIGKAGGLGYIEWGVPLNEIGSSASNLKLSFVTYDSTFNQEVNNIMVTLSPPITIQDVFPPTIGTPVRSPSSIVDKWQEVKVSVNITDADSGVRNATLLYTINNGSSWETPRTMSYNTTTGYYEVTILGQPDGMTVQYEITVYDNAGNQRTENNAGQYYVYSVVPEFPSMFVLVVFFPLAIVMTIMLSRRLKRHQVF